MTTKKKIQPVADACMKRIK